MVTVTLIGRLGNQMFEIAAAYSHSLKVGSPFYCPQRSQAPRIWPTYFHHLPKPPMGQAPLHVYKEPSHSFNEIPRHLKSVRLEGYFQCEKYFLSHRNEIIDLFKLPWKNEKGWVSVHVRRSDYLQFPNEFPTVTKEYILTSIAHISEIGNFQFKFFSDDIKWCKENFSGANIHFSSGGQPIDEMAKMSSCEHHIIANSSYSWWGAWLNQNPDKVVIAPKVWFGPGNSHLDTKDICPQNWIRI